MNKKNLILFGLIVSSICIGLLFFTSQNNDVTTGEVNVTPDYGKVSDDGRIETDPQQAQNEEEVELPAPDDITSAVLKQTPALANMDGSATFSITAITEPTDGWFVATLRKNDNTAEDARVVLRRSSSAALVVYAGPGTYFDQSLKLPVSVREALTE